MRKAFMVSCLLLAMVITPATSSAQGASLTDVQIQAITSLLQSFGVDASTITNVESILSGNAPTASVTAWCYSFNTNLRVGDYGDDVSALRTALSKNGFSNSQSSSFDERLASSVSGFQEKYKQEILSSYGLQRGTGYVGPTTRAKLNKLYGCGSTTADTPSPTPSVPTVPPSIPTATLTANQTSFISEGKPGIVTLSWSSTDTTSCSLGKTAVGTSGSRTEVIYATTSYVLNCKGSGGEILSNPVTITYTLSQSPIVSENPSITVITPNGGEVYQLGNESLSASWSYTDIAVDRQVDAYLVPTSGSGKLCYLGSTPVVNGSSNFQLSPGQLCSDNTPLTAGTYTLRLLVYKNSITLLTEDSSNSSFNLTTADAPTAILSVDKTSIVSEGKPGTITLTWVSKDATSCYIGKVPVATSGSRTELVYATTSYTVNCQGPGGEGLSNQVTVEYSTTY